MEPIKEEPEDFGTNSMMLNNIEQDPDTVDAGALVLRDVEDQSQSDTMTLGETVDQSPTDDMSLDELEDFSDAFSGGALIDRDSDDHSEASTVILANRNQQPDTQDVTMTGALDLYSNINPSPDNDNDSDEENHLALTPEPARTHRGTASSPFTDADSDDRDQTGSSVDALNGSSFDDSATSSFGSYFVGNESQPGQYGVFPYNVVNPNAFHHVPFPHPGMMPAAPWPQVPMSQPLFPMLPEPLLPHNPYVVNPPQAPAGYPYVPFVPPMQPMAFPTYCPPYAPFGYTPFGYQPVYQAPINHFGGTYPPLATERWNLDLPDTNAQRTAAAEYPVRTQTPYPPRYLPRNGSGFEYTGLASETPNWNPTSIGMFEEPGTMNRPASVNRATTGSPLERRRTTEEPFESAHSFSWTEQ
ncbi:uncharacterized protein NECHADRAFT_81480 [Fusarium vanettenii 77-13-4]|uniref:Uncharacterized protein n=1 Tax=Fusarium vanettenii (strain ATCC MYA-4622 / CBS 123669 / FGSC 9596 / NRRL 45880 / 77-13-4) TaxID=660122 RepID=C7Z959_FUSV7|nr:uncharacterized protein NECHADRAFT_81480 [Fusarium vanettenii 77-13-4]EEU38958.1 predicted protein [Fusarium vanettenii 77-13-4]